jgi:hypothetical protein
LISVTELRAKASQMRDRAEQQSDAGAAAAYRSMAEHYEAVALLSDVQDVAPGLTVCPYAADSRDGS